MPFSPFRCPARSLKLPHAPALSARAHSVTGSETRVLARTAVVLLVVSAVRYGWEARRGLPPIPSPEDDGPALLAESRLLKEDLDARGRPLEVGEQIDPNRASEVELDRLPGLGPATASAIVAARERIGGFSTPEDLLDVPGIGPATLLRIRPLLDLSREDGIARRARSPSPQGRLATAGPASALVDLNRADVVDLARLPGVGPTLARRIVDARQGRGRFLRVEELLEVRGIGPATLARLQPLIRVGPR